MLHYPFDVLRYKINRDWSRPLKLLTPRHIPNILIINLIYRFIKVKNFSFLPCISFDWLWEIKRGGASALLPGDVTVCAELFMFIS